MREALSVKEYDERQSVEEYDEESKNNQADSQGIRRVKSQEVTSYNEKKLVGSQPSRREDI
jgi:hypothetical protein